MDITSFSCEKKKMDFDLEEVDDIWEGELLTKYGFRFLIDFLVKASMALFIIFWYREKVRTG